MYSEEKVAADHCGNPPAALKVHSNAPYKLKG